MFKVGVIKDEKPKFAVERNFYKFQTAVRHARGLSKQSKTPHLIFEVVDDNVVKTYSNDEIVMNHIVEKAMKRTVGKLEAFKKAFDAVITSNEANLTEIALTLRNMILRVGDEATKVVSVVTDHKVSAVPDSDPDGNARALKAQERHTKELQRRAAVTARKAKSATKVARMAKKAAHKTSKKKAS